MNLADTEAAIARKRVELRDLFAGVDDLPAGQKAERASAIKATTTELERLIERRERMPVTPRQIDPRDEDYGTSSSAAPGVLQAIKSAESFASNFGGTTSVTLDQFLRAGLSGNWDRLPPELAIKAAGTDALGDLTLPSTLTNRVIDLTRAQSQVVAAGALTARMAGPKETLARVKTAPTPDWKFENQLISEGSIEFEPVELVARTLAARAVLSVELSDDVPTVGSALEAELSAALAAELDRAALLGSGTPPEPRGLVNTTGVTSTDVSAGLPGDYSDFSQAVQRVRMANLEPTAIVLGPDVLGEMERLVDQNGNPLGAPASWTALPKFSTTALAETAVVGDWSRFLVAMRQELRIEASRQATDENGLGFSSYSVLVRATLRADFAVLKPAAFQVLTNFEAGS